MEIEIQKIILKNKYVSTQSPNTHSCYDSSTIPIKVKIVILVPEYIIGTIVS